MALPESINPLGLMVDAPSAEHDQNHLFFGDNLAGLRQLEMAGIFVDLVYIDPPYGTSNDFFIDKDRANSISASGTLAYSDETQGDEYLSMLKVRLKAIWRVMADHASIYVHIDVKMEHRVRAVMDDIFGDHNFRNSITRIKCNPKNFDRYAYGNIKDTILFYSKSSDITWNPQLEPLDDEQMARLYPKIDANGRRFATSPLHAPGTTANGPTGRKWRGSPPPPGRHWRYPPDKLDELDSQGLIHWSSTGNSRKIRYADEAGGMLPQDVWHYKDPQNPMYPTQKNSEMLERIIKTSSNAGDVVLDCYAGSGATLLEAGRLERQFIGMDNSPAARSVIEHRLTNAMLGYTCIDHKEAIYATSTTRF